MRFLNQGEHVVVLDRYAPFLRLFTVSGDSLWAGGLSGGAPHEFTKPQAIATRDSTVYVVQHGRLGELRFRADSLAFIAATRLSGEYFPLGMETGCADKLLLYARNNRQYWATPGMVEVDYLHEMDVRGDSIDIRPLWSEAHAANPAATLGHSGVLVGSTGRSLVLLHRPDYLSPGTIIEFDCAATPLRSISERSLITGDSVPVQLPRTRGLQWTAGIAPLPRGIALPVQRYMGLNQEPLWKTEIFVFDEEAMKGSFVIPGQWWLMDYEDDAGVLMYTNDPLPHFIVLPAMHFSVPAA